MKMSNCMLISLSPSISIAWNGLSCCCCCCCNTAKVRDRMHIVMYWLDFFTLSKCCEWISKCVEFSLHCALDSDWVEWWTIQIVAWTRLCFRNCMMCLCVCVVFAFVYLLNSLTCIRQMYSSGYVDFAHK